MQIKALNEHNKKKAKNVAENLRLNDKYETLNQGEDYNDISETEKKPLFLCLKKQKEIFGRISNSKLKNT